MPLVLNKSDIEPVMRLGVPAASVLKQDFGPMIVAQREFREPHAFSERDQNASFDRASLPTHVPERAIAEMKRLLWRPQ